MVKVRYYILLLLFLWILLTIYYIVITCHHNSGVYTYYFKEMDFRFQILEKDTCDVLVLGDGDSIFYSHPLNGNYLGIEFFLSVDSDKIFLGPYFPIIYHQVGKKYMTEKIKLTLDSNDVYSPYNKERYWGVYGGCDQGRYTFGVMRNKVFYHTLEPIEWNKR